MPLDLSDVANDLLDNLAGGSYLICYESGGTENPSTGEWIPGEIVKSPVKGAESAPSDALIDGENIKTGDLLVTIPPKYPIPSGESLWFEVRGKRWSVIDYQAVYNGNVLQVNKFQLRSS